MRKLNVGMIRTHCVRIESVVCGRVFKTVNRTLWYRLRDSQDQVKGVILQRLLPSKNSHREDHMVGDSPYRN